MLGNVTSAEVYERLNKGREKCYADQKVIFDHHRIASSKERLAVRRMWAIEQKELETLLAVVVRNEPKEEGEAK